MRRVERAVLRLRLALVAAILAEHLWLLPWYGPDLEARILPVLRRQRLDGIERIEGGARACFTWRFDKARPAAPVDAGWTVRGADGPFYAYQRVETVADSWEVLPWSGSVNRPARAGQWSRKCIDVPEPLRGRPFRLTGFVEFRTKLTGRWWAIREPTAEGDVP